MPPGDMTLLSNFFSGLHVPKNFTKNHVNCLGNNSLGSWLCAHFLCVLFCRSMQPIDQTTTINDDCALKPPGVARRHEVQRFSDRCIGDMAPPESAAGTLPAPCRQPLQQLLQQQHRG